MDQVIDPVGPRTDGIRVDRRFGFVDLLENLLTGGNQANIFRATVDAADLRPGQRVLDLGCGTGKLAILAAQTLAALGGTSEVHGLDATPGMIDLARKRAQDSGQQVTWHLGVAEELPFPDHHFDAVTSTFTFHHFPDALKARVLCEVRRTLKPGGVLVITDYGLPKGLYGHLCSVPMRCNHWEYTRSQIAGVLERLIPEAGFTPPERVRAFLGYIPVLRSRPLPSAV